MNSDWYFLPLLIVILAVIGLNEARLGIISLLLLPLAAWLMFKAFENRK
jgi:hypothetical protein